MNGWICWKNIRIFWKSWTVQCSKLVFTTHLTLIRLFSSMCTNVFRVVLFWKEILFAVVTSMLFDLQVNSFSVINQCRVGFESWATFGTKKTFDILMDGDFVDSKSRSTGKEFGTWWTSIGSFSYNSKQKKILVLFQGLTFVCHKTRNYSCTASRYFEDKLVLSVSSK